MARTKTDLVKTLQQMQRATTTSAEAEAMAAIADPLQTTNRIKEALERWRAAGPEHSFESDAQFQAFIKDTTKELALHFLVTQIDALKQLSEKLSTDIDMITARDLAGIVGELGRQYALLKKTNSVEIPQSTEELDRQIEELEAKFGETTSAVKH